MKVFAFLLSSALVIGFSISSHAAEPIIIKFSHVVSADSPKGRAALYFQEMVERRTNGAVKIEVYPNSALYKDKDEIPALLAGDVQMLAPALPKIEQLGVQEFEVFNIPYLFPGKDLLRRVTGGPIGQELLKKLEPKGIVGLAYWDNGFRDLMTNKPVRHPQDLQGLKMRISSKASEPMMHALGAIPVEMAFSEVPNALKTGKIDGTENTASNFYSQKNHEVLKYFTDSDHNYIGYVVIVNKKFWDELPDNLRLQLRLAMGEATRYGNAIADRENDDALDKIKFSDKKISVYTLTPDERAEWRRELRTVHRQFEARVGKDLLKAIYEEGTALGYKF